MYLQCCPHTQMFNVRQHAHACCSNCVVSNNDCVSIHVAGFDLDQYIWASVTLYLDIINLFLKILQLLNGRRD